MIDIAACDLFVTFSEHPGSPHVSGGRHVETGMALAMDRRVIVVGPAENIFHRDSGCTCRTCGHLVERYDTWDELVPWLAMRQMKLGRLAEVVANVQAGRVGGPDDGAVTHA